MKSAKPLCLAVFALAIPATHAATILYSHTFSSTSTSALNGTQVEGGTLSTGINWASNGTVIRQNGTTNGLAGTAGNGSAILPFTPLTGMIYTLTTTISSTTGNWGGIGFSNAAANWASQADTRFTGTSNAGQPWMMHATNGQSAYLGPGTFTEIFGTDVLPSPTTAPVTLSVVLNTIDTAWTAAYFVNGTQFGATTAFSTNPSINSVGLTTTNTGTRDFSNFSLTAVPEPSAALLGGLGMLALLRRRRNDTMRSSTSAWPKSEISRVAIE